MLSVNNDNPNKSSTVLSNQETQELNNDFDSEREERTQAFVQISPDQLTSEQSFVTTTPKEGEILSPSISTNPNSNKNSPLKKIFIGIFVSFLILFTVGITAMYALSYGKITLPQFPEFQRKVSFFAMDYLPFASKSAQYLLYKAVLANGEYSSYAFDISMAVSSSNLAVLDVLRFYNYDFLAKGSIDYSNTDNVISSANVSFSKDINIDLVLKDKILYFKINKVSPAMLSLIGINPEKVTSLMNIWVSQDTNAFSSDARKLLKESQNNNKSLQIAERLIKIFTNTIAKEIEVEKTEKEGSSLYKLTLSPSKETLHKILTELIKEIYSRDEDYDSEFEERASALSEIIKDVRIEVWIDASTFYLKHVSAEFAVKSGSQLNENTLNIGVGADQFLNMKIATVVKFSEFGKKVEVSTLPTAMTSEEFFIKLAEITIESYMTEPNYSKQYNNFEQLPQP